MVWRTPIRVAARVVASLRLKPPGTLSMLSRKSTMILPSFGSTVILTRMGMPSSATPGTGSWEPWPFRTTLGIFLISSLMHLAPYSCHSSKKALIVSTPYFSQSSMQRRSPVRMAPIWAR